jgi:serine/threonine-protein kinase
VIHRDLKPANIMVGAFGEVQVMDWGLAKVLAEGGLADEERANRSHQEVEDVTTIRTARSSGSAVGLGTETEAGSLLGTPAYMPPEQANGDVASLDRRADVFGLGAILCEILTGKPPYVGRSAEEVRRKSANGDLVDAHARLDRCGADLELITLTQACLASEAIDRPKDAQAVVDGLTAYQNGVQERLHQAELAEAEARAKAVEEAKRRRLTLALAGTVLLALTLGGGGWLYVKNEREARQAQVTREVNETLNRVTALREQARTASAGGAALFAQAREQAQRALALVESGPADDTLKNLVRQLQAELDEEEKDRTLLSALDEARLAQAETVAGENRFADERAVPRFREAFRAYGLPAGEGEPKVAAERIRQRPAAVREAILAALDEWDDLAANPKLKISEPHREWLRAVLEAAEPDDAWGRKVRAARRESDAVKRQAALEALARSATVAEVPARALTRLAKQLGPSQAAELLRRAQRHYPADIWVNSQLGWALQEMTPPERAEAVRFLTVAVALRPESPGAHFNLGLALARKGQLDEAIDCYKKAIELDPKYAYPHYDLGNALMAKGQLDDAITSFQKAITVDPKNVTAHNVLGYALARKGKLDEAIDCYKKAIALDPKYAGAHGNLGSALAGKGQLHDAIASHKKALELDPNSAAGHNNLADTLANAVDPKRRDPVQAIAHAKRATELDPNLEVGWITLGEAWYRNGQWEEAITALDKGLALLKSGNGEAFFFLAMAHHRAGHKGEAQKSYDKGIAWMDKHAPKDPILLRYRTEAASVLGVK